MDYGAPGTVDRVGIRLAFQFSGKMQLGHDRPMAETDKLTPRLSTNGGPNAMNG
jgi:hypothetical protein